MTAFNDYMFIFEFYILLQLPIIENKCRYILSLFV